MDVKDMMKEEYGDVDLRDPFESPYFDTMIEEMIEREKNEFATAIRSRDNDLPLIHQEFTLPKSVKRQRRKEKIKKLFGL